MTGALIVAPHVEASPHSCAPPVGPGLQNPAFYAEISADKYRTTSVDWIGAVWRCDCGQHWHADHMAVWWRISARKARRLAKKAGIA